MNFPKNNFFSEEVNFLRPNKFYIIFNDSRPKKIEKAIISNILAVQPFPKAPQERQENSNPTNEFTLTFVEMFGKYYKVC